MNKVHKGKDKADYAKWVAGQVKHSPQGKNVNDPMKPAIQLENKTMSKWIRTLDEGRKRIEELETQLAGKSTPTPPVSKPTVAAVKKLVSAASASGTLPTLEAISRELKGEDSSSARITYLNGVVSDYQNAISAARKAKDYAAQTNLFRSLHKISKRQAEELRADPVAWKNIFKTPPSDL